MKFGKSRISLYAYCGKLQALILNGCWEDWQVKRGTAKVLRKFLCWWWWAIAVTWHANFGQNKHSYNQSYARGQRECRPRHITPEWTRHRTKYFYPIWHERWLRNEKNHVVWNDEVCRARSRDAVCVGVCNNYWHCGVKRDTRKIWLFTQSLYHQIRNRSFAVRGRAHKCERQSWVSRN